MPVKLERDQYYSLQCEETWHFRPSRSWTVSKTKDGALCNSCRSPTSPTDLRLRDIEYETLLDEHISKCEAGQAIIRTDLMACLKNLSGFDHGTIGTLYDLHRVPTETHSTLSFSKRVFRRVPSVRDIWVCAECGFISIKPMLDDDRPDVLLVEDVKDRVIVQDRIGIIFVRGDWVETLCRQVPDLTPGAFEVVDRPPSGIRFAHDPVWPNTKLPEEWLAAQRS